MGGSKSAGRLLPLRSAQHQVGNAGLSRKARLAAGGAKQLLGYRIFKAAFGITLPRLSNTRQKYVDHIDT